METRMEAMIEITQEEYKALLESHVLLQRAERTLAKKRKDYYQACEIADMIGMDWEEEK